MELRLSQKESLNSLWNDSEDSQNGSEQKESLSRFTKLQRAYIQMREIISTRGRKKEILLNTSGYERLPISPMTQNYEAVFRTSLANQPLEHRRMAHPNFKLLSLEEEKLNTFLWELGEKSAQTVGGLETKTIKNGFNVGINFKDTGSYVSKDAADFYFIIQVYNPSQSLEILREEADGKISKAVLTPNKLKKDFRHNGRNYQNVYAVKGKRGDLAKYQFCANVKSVCRVEKPVVYLS